MTSKKKVEIKRGESLFWGIDGGPGTPWEGDLGGGKNGSMDKGKEVDYLNTPWAKARRICYFDCCVAGMIF